MKDEFSAKLGIFSKTVTPDQLNSFLGIKCDKGYLIGDLRKPSIIREKENAWIVYSRLSRYAPLEQHIKDVLERVSPIKGRIGEISSRPDVEVEFGCSVHTANRPAMFFTRQQVADICAMGASIDIDLYLLPEEH